MRPGLPRLLVVLGSGETAPTMVTPHREVFARLREAAGGAVPAVLVDTPVGFQENAGEIAERAVAYFAASVGERVEVASYRRREVGVATDEALVRLREAGWIFSGPGSPTYALRQWQDSPVPDALAATLREGGAVVFASAAALTLGVATVPVYEVYKSGEDPHWLPGLDLLGAATGLSAAVIPHYDNAEGGGHDTRYCYLGERRLAAMERELPDDAFVLGVDEHTGLVLDLSAGSARVVGRGGVTLRRAGHSTVLPTGSTVSLEEFRRLATEAGAPSRRSSAPTADNGQGAPHPTQQSAAAAADPLAAAVEARQAEFDRALAARDVPAAVAAILAVESELAAWAADTLQSDAAQRGRAALRAMVVQLGRLAESGAGNPRDAVAAFVETLLELRGAARADRRYADADLIRDRLTAAGVEVRDTPDGVVWDLAASH